MPPGRPQLSPGRTIVMTVVAVALFFALLEGVLALFGVQRVDVSRDPFVGFAANSPLFVEEESVEGGPLLVTAPNKHLFNRQRFPRVKAPGTRRVFCLGGSTTFGRPYDDRTSFSAWMRELLVDADPDHRWEVINAGGTSYASYRVAHLMQELVRYEPDLFVIYTGHNEFLEERSYGTLRAMPGPVRSTAAVLARTRTWAGLSRLLGRTGLLGPEVPQDRTQLPGEADTMLEHFGPAIYHRDDALREGILEHYRVSLTRMVQIAQSAGAGVIVVTPASNLKDCSPFKSEHTESLDEPGRARSLELLARGRELLHASRWEDALVALNEAALMDPRHAEHHYRRGQALFELGRMEEARAAFVRARDEDVCPLRALSPMKEVLAEVAAQTGASLVDFIDVMEQHARAADGHGILGEDHFLDHVHLTIEANGILAARLVGEMIRRGDVRSNEPPGPDAIAAVASRVESRLDPEMQARALCNLAQVIAWSGKSEDANRIALAALEQGVTDPSIVAPSASIVATHAALQGDLVQERKYYRMALNAAPRSAEMHFRIGLRCLDREPAEIETAAAHIFFASVFWPGERLDEIHRVLADVLAQRGRFEASLSHLLEARRLHPGDPETESLLVRVRERLGDAARDVVPPKIILEDYPSGALHKVIQVRLTAAGEPVPDGIWTEWYEGGEVKRLVDYVGGVPHGNDVRWAPTGEVTERSDYVRGQRVGTGG